jgi:hypothetical protein
LFFSPSFPSFHRYFLFFLCLYFPYDLLRI